MIKPDFLQLIPKRIDSLNEPEHPAIYAMRKEAQEKYFSAWHLDEDNMKKNWSSFQVTKENEKSVKQVQAISPDDSFGAYIFGPAGSGKSHLMKSLINQLLEAKVKNRINHELNGEEILDMRCLWFPVTRSLDQIRDGNKDLKKLAMTVEHLFMDDIGAHNKTEWGAEQIYLILDARAEKLRQTFITSNVTIDELGKQLHERVGSRIKEICVPISLTGLDRRVDRMRENMKVLASRMNEVG